MGRYLSERPIFTLDPLLHCGCYYVQEASSMLLEQAFVRTGIGHKDVMALDLCAAPGGKSTHLSALLSPGSLLICNEPVRGRQPSLTENLWKQGLRHPVITASDPSALDMLPGRFDLIVVDAPCSGEGMFRKDPFARQQWSAGLVAHCAKEQSRILRHAWYALKPGGWIIYSTCTWERTENEDRVKDLTDLGGVFVPLALDPSWGIVDTDAGHRCYPHRLRGEGFFISLVQKPGEPARNPEAFVADSLPAGFAEWIDAPSERMVREQDDTVFLLPARWAEEITRIQAHMNVIAPGTPIADRKGARWFPTAALALNLELRRASFTPIEVDHMNALRFLRGEMIDMGTSPGTHDALSDPLLVRYEGYPLGFLSAAGHRWNNRWPKPWRIRMR